MLSQVVIDKAFFIVICVFAGIGALIVALVLLYILFGILDLTYQERHKKQETKSKCPDKIE